MLKRDPEPHSPDERLSQLIRLKSFEKPDEAFWNRFDAELRSKQLAALVRTQSGFQRTLKLASFLLRKTAPVSAAFSVFAFALFAVTQMEFLAKRDSIEQPLPTNQFASIRPTENPTFDVLEDVSDELDPSVDPATASGAAVYQINALTRNYQPANFRVVASPMELTIERASASAGGVASRPAGARILKAAGRQF